jgi:hypothetical protein
MALAEKSDFFEKIRFLGRSQLGKGWTWLDHRFQQ